MKSTPERLHATGKVPAAWTWHHRTLRDLHRRLVREHDEHRHDSSAPADKDTHDFGDTASVERERETLFSTLLSEGNRLAEVEAALNRIYAGMYGVCEATGRTIPDERLRAVPWTRFCKEAAEEIEHRRRPA